MAVETDGSPPAAGPDCTMYNPQPVGPMRLFIASTFPAEIMRDLNDRVAHFRPRLPSASWVRPESQHLTFAFLGDQPDTTLEQASPRLTDALSHLPPFEASLSAGGFFPNSRHARVGWVGLDPDAPFLRTAQAVRDAITSAGVRFDGSEFKPHLTLMRIRDPWPPASLELFQRSLRDYRSTPFRVESVTMYSSRLDPKGAVHTALRTFALGGTGQAPAGTEPGLG